MILMMQAAPGQEFEVASIKRVPTRSGDIRLIDHGSGGPGSNDPAMFRCGNCLLVSLIEKAFDLQRYQFVPGPWMMDNEYQVLAKVPEGTTPQQFRTMLQKFLKERFNLSYHFEKKETDGLALVIAKGGSKLKESTTPASVSPAPPVNERAILGKDGYPVLNHPGQIGLNGHVRMRSDRQTAGDIAHMLGEQYALPVEDATGLTGIYDINLFWVVNSRSAVPADPNDTAPLVENPGPSFRDALQSQLGLKFEPKKVKVNIFVIDHVDKMPTAN
jgi:uncharacterized protein (TIGR03435 family)